MEENNNLEQQETKGTIESAMESKRTKNLIAAIILLAGLFVGSIFVDVGQLLKGEGFSMKNLSQSDVFEANGKTWVAFSEPAVSLKVLSDETCQNCDPSEVLVWLRRIAPTVSAQKIDVNSPEGQALIDKFNIKAIPAFVFSDKITNTEFYSQAQSLFTNQDDEYMLNTTELGLAPGKIIATPDLGPDNMTVGPKDAKVKVVIFSDFQCPYCKAFHQAVRQEMKEFSDKVEFSFRNYPLSSIHKQADNAAIAAECAADQNKFWDYADYLFAHQSDWGNTTDLSRFKIYAKTLGLNSDQFAQCVDQNKFKDQIDKDKQEAEAFGISGTPAVFVNDQFKNAALTADQLKDLINTELNK